MDTQTNWKGNRLYYGTRSTGFSVQADDRFPGMWRVRTPNGWQSDMVNRTRAKDVAEAMLNTSFRRQRAAEAPRTS